LSLHDYTLLGTSGLRVSRLALGGMTFGKPWTGNSSTAELHWGMDQSAVNEVLAAYVDAGGNFIDTADHYGGGASEEAIGKFINSHGLRNRLVVGTKFGFSGEDGNPNAGGAGRKNILRSLEGSLRRLRLEYVDLFSLHASDGLTPADEVLRTLDDLVRAGKVRHVGLSNVPAWYASRLQTLAETRGLEPACAMQLKYSLVERDIEFEHVPLCLESGMGVTVWGPLNSGFLTGKYRRAVDKAAGEGRLSETAGMARIDDRSWRILDVLQAVADEVSRTPAQVALNWVTARPGIASVIVGVTSVKQLQSNLAALDFTLAPELAARLDEASAPTLRYPYDYLRGTNAMVLGARVKRLGRA
jgi:aryl-alcohol dehydrogenase-like predicted oxidoreductase